MKRAIRTAQVAGLAMPCLWALTYLLPPLNGDVAAILLFAVRMARGDQLYVDIIDVNPPLIFWLNLGPAWLADRFGVSPAVILILSVLALQPLALALCRRPLAHLRSLQDGDMRWPLCGAVLFALLVLPSDNFGQREALVTSLALPYLALAAMRMEGQSIGAAGAAGRAAFSAIGFLIKPYFLLVPVAVELALLLRCGPKAWARRPEPWTIAGLAVGYLALALALHPAYFTDVLPLVDRYYLVSDLAGSAVRVFGAPERLVVILALAPVISYALLDGRNPVLRVAGLFTVAMALSAFVQGKGWPYHLLPLWQGGAVAATLVAAELLQCVAGPWQLSRHGIQAIAMTAVALATVAFGWIHPPLRDRLNYRESFAGRLEPLLAREARGKNVLWLTDAIYPKYPVTLYDDARPAARFMELWLIDGLYRGAHVPGARPAMRAPAQMSADERRLFNTVGMSLERSRPALVLVASAAIELGVRSGAFDYLAYFLRHPSFAREWRHYSEIAEIDGTRIYRRDAGG